MATALELTRFLGACRIPRDRDRLRRDFETERNKVLTMSKAVKEAKQHIADALAIALDVFDNAKKALAEVGCDVVPTKRLEALEELAKAVEEAEKTVLMTRRYDDCRNRDGGEYNGKRWLVRRDEGANVFKAMQKVRNS